MSAGRPDGWLHRRGPGPRDPYPAEKVLSAYFFRLDALGKKLDPIGFGLDIVSWQIPDGSPGQEGL